MRQTPLLVLTALGLTLAACDTSTPPDSLPPPRLSKTAAADYADAPESFDAILNDVSRRHPGFKGLIASEDGARTLVLADGPAALATSGLLPDLARVLRKDVSRLVRSAAPAARAGGGPRRDFHELYAAKVALRRLLFEGDAVTMLDIDDETGRIAVGVASAADEAQARGRMTAEELALVDFVRYERAVLLVGKADPSARSVGTTSSMTVRSLRFDAFRPLIAGGETKFTNPRLNSGTACTQGPVVRHSNGKYGFLSNAHCTLDRSQIDNTQFFQPVKQPSDLIGIEVDEAEYRSGVFITDGYYSDAAFVSATAGFQLRGQMTSADNCVGALDCIENGIINDVTGTSSNLPVNVRVFKTGRTTGSTAGRITRACFDIDTSDGKNLCQSEVRYDPAVPSPPQLADGGDSGSAVMTNGGTPGSSAGTVAGILWGGLTNDPGVFFFSPWQGITGSNYGIPVQIVTASAGVVSNTTSSGGGGGGGGGDPGCEPQQGSTVTMAVPPPC